MDFDLQFSIKVLGKCIEAVPLTLYVSLWAFFFGLILAIFIALVRYYEIPILKRICQFYVSFIRGTPALLQLYIVYYMIPMGVDSMLSHTSLEFRSGDIEIKVLVMIAFTINVSAYLSETIRSGLVSLGRGEIEAGYSIGMTRRQILSRIVIPQVLVLCIPNFSSNLIGLVQTTSLAYFISLAEVTGTARILASSNWKYFEAFVVTGIIYWILTVIIEIVTYVIEKIAIARGYNFQIQQ